MSEYEKLHARIAQLVERNNQLGAELECALGDLATAKGIIERDQEDAECFRYLAECKEWPDEISDLVDCGSTGAIRAAILLELAK